MESGPIRALITGPVEVELFKRAFVHGRLIHTRSYERTKKRNSYTLEYSCDNQSYYGSVEAFLKVSTQEEEVFLAAVRQIPVDKDFLFSTDTTVSFVTKGVTKVLNRNTDLTLVPLQNVGRLLIAVQTQGSAPLIAKIPNVVEKD